jgi:AbrB family looped-hinge helix DNA binding protein
MKTVRVSDKGQIAIPQEMRERIGIRRGDSLVLVLVDDKLLIQKEQNVAAKLTDDFKDLLRFNEKSLKSVWGNKSDDIWSVYLR